MVITQNNKTLFRLSLSQINIAAYLALFVVVHSIRIFEIDWLRYLESFLLVVIIFILGGLNIATIFKTFYRKNFTRLELLNVAAVVGLVFVPLVCLMEISFFHEYFHFLAVANSAIYYFIGLFLYRFISRRNNCSGSPYALIELRDEDKSKYVFLGLVLLIYSGVVGIIISAYYALPDADPYYWMSHTQSCINSGFFQSCLGERALFESINLLFTYSAKIDVYAYFKYVFPFISLLIIFPVLLVANSAKSFAGKMVIALLPLSVPSTLLYLLTPMPQASAIVLSFCFIYWLLYSYIYGKEFFYYLAGVTSFFIFWYHEVGILFFIFWLIVSVYRGRRKVFRYLFSYRNNSILLILLFLTNIRYLKEPYVFVSFWAKKIILSLHFETNIFFPSSYINIDGNSMGWPGVIGVSKYYLFYVGPVLLFFLVYFLFIFLKKRKLYIQKIVSKTPGNELIIFSIAFVFFFSFAEIVPRVFNYSFLPERVWIFTGITLFFVLVLLSKEWDKSFLMRYGFLCCVIVGTAGAVYVNFQKGFMLPNYRLNAAKWIVENLDDDRIILSRGDKKLLRYFSQSRYYLMPESFFCDKKIINSDDIWDYFLSGKVEYTPKKESVEAAFRIEFEEYLKKHKPVTSTSLQAIFSKYTAISNHVDNQLGKEDLVSSGYIYYYKEDERNPYINRPYYKNIKLCESTYFDEHPDFFRLIYNDRGMVKIWKIIK